jgi:hypothetical protein
MPGWPGPEAGSLKNELRHSFKFERTLTSWIVQLLQKKIQLAQTS